MYKKYRKLEFEAIRWFDKKPLPLNILSHAVILIWF
jgi:hypothetical protein